MLVLPTIFCTWVVEFAQVESFLEAPKSGLPEAVKPWDEIKAVMFGEVPFGMKF